MKLIKLIELCRIHIRSILWVLCSFKIETHRGYFHFTSLMMSICLSWDAFTQLNPYKFTYPWHFFNHRSTRFPEGFLLYSCSYDHYFIQKNNISSITVRLNSMWIPLWSHIQFNLKGNEQFHNQCLGLSLHNLRFLMMLGI